MAIYHFSCKMISRGNSQKRTNSLEKETAKKTADTGKKSNRSGANAVRRAAYLNGARYEAVREAAYISGGQLQVTETRQVFSYVNKKGVVFSEVLAPPGAPAWVFDFQKLWNRVEKSEDLYNHRKDVAQLAREIDIALPNELTHKQNIALMSQYILEQFVGEGMIAHWAFHHEKADNPHVHILLTTRRLTPEGKFDENKERTWNNRKLIGKWRKAWEVICNEHLQRYKHKARICADSYKKQQKNLGYPVIPTLHRGVFNCSQEKKTGYSKVKELNDAISTVNLYVQKLFENVSYPMLNLFKSNKSGLREDAVGSVEKLHKMIAELPDTQPKKIRTILDTINDVLVFIKWKKLPAATVETAAGWQKGGDMAEGASPTRGIVTY